MNTLNEVKGTIINPRQQEQFIKNAPFPILCQWLARQYEQQNWEFAKRLAAEIQSQLSEAQYGH